MRVPESQKLCLSRRIVGGEGSAGPGVIQGREYRLVASQYKRALATRTRSAIYSRDLAVYSIARWLGAQKVRCTKKKVR